jgi:hypothetical protein
MQVNSAQDYLTSVKRRILASTFVANPPPAHRRSNDVVLAIEANRAEVVMRQTLPLFPYGSRVTSNCCLGRNGTLPGSAI